MLSFTIIRHNWLFRKTTKTLINGKILKTPLTLIKSVRTIWLNLTVNVEYIYVKNYL